mgnify:CR=1 FL=1
MQSDFIIGQISDTHFVDKNHKLFDKYDTYSRLVNTINTCNKLIRKPDFYIISGDLIHDDETFYKDFFELCNNLEKPVYPMMGNHDKRYALKKYLKSNLIDQYGYLNYTISSYPVEIICLDTAIENKIEGNIANTSMKWLEEKLLKNPIKPIIIFMHHPPIDIGSLLFDHIKCNNGNEFIELISKYKNVRKVIFGHVHCFFNKFVNGIEFVSCPSASIQYPIDAKTDKNINLDIRGYIKLINCTKQKIIQDHYEIN